MASGLLILNAPPALEEPLVDWLLEQTYVQGFTSMQVYGHGSAHSSMSIGEQVLGRQKRTQFMIHGEILNLEQLLHGLQQVYPRAGLHYFLSPVISGGPITGVSAE